MAEVKITRDRIPGIIKEIKPITRNVENVAEKLPKIIDPVLDEVAKTREAVPGILKTVESTNLTVEKAVTEISQVRKAAPELLGRAEKIVANARDVGREASKGAVSGLFGGVISMPLDMVEGMGARATRLLNEEDRKQITQEDVRMIHSKAIELAEEGNVGQSKIWENIRSGNKGRITLRKKYETEGKPCREVEIEYNLKRRRKQIKTIRGCRQPDGVWVAEDQSGPEYR